MAKIVVMPKLGLVMTAGTIVTWLKSVGDPVTEGEPLFDVETEKLTNTIEAPASGTLLRILVDAGSKVPCFTPVGVIGAVGEDISALLAQSAEESGGAGAAQAENQTPAGPEQPAAALDQPAGRVVASPAARRLAKELGVDLALVTGTGPKGRISEEDVRAFHTAAASPVPKATPLAAKLAAEQGISLSDVPAQGRITAADVADQCPPPDEGETVPMTGMRRTIAENMCNSHLTSPTVTYHIHVDMSAAGKLREALRQAGIKVSYTDLLVQVTAQALRQFPVVNSSVTDQSIRYHSHINIGVAVALEQGLLVPNIPDADKKGLREISAMLRQLSAAARSGTLSMDRLQGGTFTISNLGMYGMERFTPIINQPEVAILGVNAIEEQVVALHGQAVIRPMMGLSLTADHRAIDGAVAAQFLQRIKALLETPALLLA